MDYKNVEEKRLYAIREVSEMTGVKPVTLRAWQRRYGLVQPERTEKGHRLYTDANIGMINEIQDWLSKGVSIGKVKALLTSGSDNELVAEAANLVLEEVDLLLSSLAALNKGQAESTIATVFKEYPLDIVSDQFVLPAIKAMGLVKGPLRTIQQALFQSLMVTRLTMIVEAESKASTKGKCLFVNLDTVGSVPAWLFAVRQAEQGFNVTVLDGVDDLAVIGDESVLDSYQRVTLFSNKALVQRQQNKLKALVTQTKTEITTSEVLSKLHLSE